jgi:hypothetical protein
MSVVDGPTRIWSPFQSAIYDAVEKSSDSLVVEAAAGSGKTVTLVESANRLDDWADACAIAFNKRIADELTKHLPNTVPALTLNAAGFRAWKRFTDKPVPVDAHKVTDLVRGMADDSNPEYRKGVVRLVGLAKMAGVVPSYVKMETCPLREDTTETWTSLINEYGVSFGWGDKSAQAVELARRVLAQSVTTCGESIDFNDQLYLPVVFGADFVKFGVIFCDELQDLSAIQFTMVERSLSKGGRFVGFGDRNQCHPPGVKVQLTGGETHLIESIAPGQQVVTYNNGKSYFPGVMSQGRKILDVGSRHYSGPLLQLSAGDKSVEVTPNHRIPTKFVRNGYAVYLMRRGRQYRVGMCKLFYRHGFGPAIRSRHEQADAAWVLKAFDKKEDAAIHEMHIAAKFGLPQFLFCATNGNEKYEKILKAAWHHIDNSILGEHCLLEHAMSPEHPIYLSGCEPHPVVGRKMFITQASNLLPDFMSVRTFDGSCISGAWEPVKVLMRNYSGPVYSLEVEPNEHGQPLYVANGILVRNSIYAWRGAIDAMPLAVERFGARTLPLSICYRCAKSIVRKAQEFVPTIQAFDGAEEGLVDENSTWTTDSFRLTDAILCRNNAPLVKLAFRLIRAGKPAKVRGRDIGNGLVALVRRFRANSMDELREKLSKWQAVEIVKANGRQDQIQSVTDRAETLRVFIDNSRSPDECVNKIESLFADDAAGYVTLSSVHGAKGLEWPRVWLLDPELIGKRAETEQEKMTERNVFYVAVTRAQREFRFIRSQG